MFAKEGELAAYLASRNLFIASSSFCNASPYCAKLPLCWAWRTASIAELTSCSAAAFAADNAA